MKRNTKIIQIAGLRGIAMVLFIGICLAAGFIIFPAKVAMYLWNTFIAGNFEISVINLWQGLLLWVGTILTLYIANGGNMLISFHEPAQLNEEEMRMLMDRIKFQARARKINSMMMRTDELKKLQTGGDVKETTEVSNIAEETKNKKS